MTLLFPHVAQNQKGGYIVGYRVYIVYLFKALGADVFWAT